MEIPQNIQQQTKLPTLLHSRLWSLVSSLVSLGDKTRRNKLCGLNTGPLAHCGGSLADRAGVSLVTMCDGVRSTLALTNHWLRLPLTQSHEQTSGGKLW